MPRSAPPSVPVIDAPRRGVVKIEERPTKRGRAVMLVTLECSHQIWMRGRRRPPLTAECIVCGDLGMFTLPSVPERILALLRPLDGYSGERMDAIKKLGGSICMWASGCGRDLAPGERCHCENDE